MHVKKEGNKCTLSVTLLLQKEQLVGSALVYNKFSCFLKAGILEVQSDFNSEIFATGVKLFANLRAHNL